MKLSGRLKSSSKIRAVGLAAVAGFWSAAAAANVTDINGLDLELRDIFNNYPDSVISVNGTPESSAATAISVSSETPGEFLRVEEGPLGDFDFLAGGSFRANTHRAWFSDDGGSARFLFQEGTAFDISVDIQINSTSNAPRKEAGFFFNIGTGSDPQFIITTDNGEVAAFAGTHPKASSVGNQGPEGLEFGGATYTAGTVATLRMVYLPPTRDVDTGAIIDLGSMEYFFNGISATGEPQLFDDVPGIGGLLPNTELSLKVQNQGSLFTNDPTETTFVFSNLVIVDPLAGSFLVSDFNQSGSVEQGDLDLVLNNWGTDTTGNVPAGWLNTTGLSGAVDQAELDLVLNNWGSSSAPSFAGLAVPEPALATLIAAMSAVAAGRRRGR